MKITKELLIPIKSYTAEMFSAWFINNLEKHTHREKFSNTAIFQPLRFISDYDLDPLNALNDIYDLLDEDQKTEFRQGLAQAIAVQQPIEWSVAMLKLMMGLAKQIQAKEVLVSIASHIGYENLDSAKDNGIIAALFSDMLETVVCINFCEMTAETIRCLISSKYFQPKNAPIALYGLAKSEPDNFSAHMDLLRNAFSLLYADCDADGAVLTANRIRKCLGWERLDKHIFKPGDEWLRSNLRLLPHRDG